MTSPPSVDYPDWNPPRDRLSQTASGSLGFAVDDGQAGQVILAADSLDNSVIVEAELPPGVALNVFSAGTNFSDFAPRTVVCAGAVPLDVAVPFLHRGEGLTVEIINNSGAHVDLTVEVTSFSSVAPSEQVPSASWAIIPGVVVPGMAASDPIDIPLACEYTEATITVVCDQPATVTLRRPWVLTVAPYTAGLFDVALGAVVGGVAKDFTVPVGSPGAAVVLAGTGATDGSADVLTVARRAGGF